MSKKEMNFNFKRGISQISSGSGGASAISNGHVDLNHKKKTGKLRQGADYMMPRGQVPGTSTQSNSLDITSENVAGGMSMKDIEVMMSEKEEPPQAQQISPRSIEQVSLGAPTLSGSWGAEDVLRNARKLSLKSLPVKCVDPYCNSCDWHYLVLKYPHKVQWMAKTVKVELRSQKDCSWPGFHHKQKNHTKKNETESYFLVTEITKDSVASGSGLCVGDLMLSVNSIPLQSGKENLVKFSNYDTLILQIQHPEGLSPDILLKRPLVNIPGLQQPPSPSPSPPDIGNTSPHNHIPLCPLKKPEEYQPLSQATIFVCGNSATEFVNCFVGDRISSFVELNSCAFCFDLSLKWTQASTFSSGGSVTVDNWESLSHLFKENEDKAKNIPSASLLSCINVRLVVVEDDNFFFSCCPWMYSSSSVFILTFDTHRLLASSQTELSRLTRIASAVRTGMLKHKRPVYDGTAPPFSQVMPRPGAAVGSHPYLMMVGIETSEAFNPEEIRTPFYTSLGEALPRPDIIPVRQGHMSSQMTSLRQRIFLVLSGCPTATPITPPSAIFPNGTRAAATHLAAGNASFHENLLQGSQLRMSYLTCFALDIISNLRSLTISQRQLLKILQEDSSDFEESPAATNGLPSLAPRYVNGSKHGSFQHESVFARVLEDLRNSRNLILLDSVNTGCWSEWDKEFVLPAILFDKILRLAQRVVAGGLTEAQQNILRSLGACGVVSRLEMAELLKLVSSQPERLLLCLDDLQLTFAVRSGQHDMQQEPDSGFDDGLSVLCPYFKEDVLFEPARLHGFIEHWTICFSEEAPLSSFYCILSELSVQWLPGFQITLYSQLVACVTQGGVGGGSLQSQLGCQHQLPCGTVLYYICFQQQLNQIKAYKKRTSSHGAMPLSKENQMTEQLSCSRLKEIAKKHVSASTQVFEIQTSPSPSNPKISNPRSLEKYKGDFKVEIPDHIKEEHEENGEPNGAASAASGEDEAHMQMLSTRVDDLVFINEELKDIYDFLSMDGDWTELAGHLGLSTKEVKVCRSIFETRPNIPIGRTFLENILTERGLTMRVLLIALQNMTKKIYRSFAEKLWTAALLNNSRYYLDLRRNGNIK